MEAVLDTVTMNKALNGPTKMTPHKMGKVVKREPNKKGWKKRKEHEEGY